MRGALYIWDADYPWDVRVEKICNSLSNNGYHVHIAARNLKQSAQYEVINGIHIHRLKSYQNAKINYLLSFPLFFSPIWKRLIDNIIYKEKIDIIIVRDLPMAIAGILAGRRHNIPVILDMAEDYVSMIKRIWKRRKFSGINLILRNPYIARYVEKYTLKNIDHIFVVVEEAKHTIVERGYSKDKITIVENTPRINNTTIDTLEIDNSDCDLISDKFAIIYTGGIQLGRGLQTVIESIPEIIKHIPDFLFVIVGDGYATNTLKKYANELKVSDYILWKGWLEHQYLLKYISISKAGIIPHLKTEHTDTTMPNKIYDYMWLGLPVITSNTVPMMRLVKSEKCGVTFKSGNSKELINAITILDKNIKEYGIRGANAVKHKYNWCEDEHRLINTIKTLLAES
jgi:glycosyltransferase involved in cell wall biosynthesis